MSLSFLSHKPEQFFISKSDSPSVPITPLLQKDFSAWRDKQSEGSQRWVETNNFSAKPGEICLIPAQDHRISSVLFGLGNTWDFWSFGSLPLSLPRGVYHFEAQNTASDPLFRACLAWMLGAYQFSKYKSNSPSEAQLVCPDGVDYIQCLTQAESIYFTRDLINTPAEDMGPAELTYAAQQLGKQHKANVEVLIGDELLTKNFPAIHTVGRASSREPRLIDIKWQPKKSSRTITLIGKGVTFDSGGLDLKP